VPVGMALLCHIMDWYGAYHRPTCHITSCSTNTKRCIYYYYYFFKKVKTGNIIRHDST